jgi:hypothetical protein
LQCYLQHTCLLHRIRYRYRYGEVTQVTDPPGTPGVENSVTGTQKKPWYKLETPFLQHHGWIWTIHVPVHVLARMVAVLALNLLGSPEELLRYRSLPSIPSTLPICTSITSACEAPGTGTGGGADTGNHMVEGLGRCKQSPRTWTSTKIIYSCRCRYCAHNLSTTHRRIRVTYR